MAARKVATGEAGEVRTAATVVAMAVAEVAATKGATKVRVVRVGYLAGVGATTEGCAGLVVTVGSVGEQAVLALLAVLVGEKKENTCSAVFCRPWA